MRLAERLSPEILAGALTIVVTLGVLGAAFRPKDSPAPTSPGPSASARPVEPSPSDALPSLVRSSLSTIVIVNGRLTAVAEDLTAELSRTTPRASELAADLRSVAAEITAVDQPVGQLVGHPLTSRLGLDLEQAYGSIVDLVRSVTAQSVQDARAYIEASRTVVKQIGALAPLTARAQAILAGALPSATPVRPSATPSAQSSPPPVTPSATASSGSAGPGGLIANGDFEAGAAPWVLRTTPPAAAALTIDTAGANTGTAAARIDITAGTDARSGISLIQTGMALQAGQTYRIQVSLRSTAARDVRIQLGSSTGEVYAARIFPATATWSTVSFDVGVLVDDPSAIFGVDVGRSTASVWLDTISVRTVG